MVLLQRLLTQSSLPFKDRRRRVGNLTSLSRSRLQFPSDKEQPFYMPGYYTTNVSLLNMAFIFLKLLRLLCLGIAKNDFTV